MAGIVGSFLIAKAQAYLKEKSENFDPVASMLAFCELVKIYTLYHRFKEGKIRDAAPWLLMGGCLALLKSKNKKFEVIDALTLHTTEPPYSKKDLKLIVFPIIVLAANFLLMRDRGIKNFDPLMPITALAQGASVVRLVTFRL